MPVKPLYECKIPEEHKKKRKKSLSDKEILKKLKELRDNALNWWGYVVEMQNTAGSSTAAEMFKRSMDELERLEMKNSASKIQGKIELVFSKPDEEEVKDNE